MRQQPVSDLHPRQRDSLGKCRLPQIPNDDPKEQKTPRNDCRRGTAGFMPLVLVRARLFVCAYSADGYGLLACRSACLHMYVTTISGTCMDGNLLVRSATDTSRVLISVLSSPVWDRNIPPFLFPSGRVTATDYQQSHVYPRCAILYLHLQYPLPFSCTAPYVCRQAEVTALPW